MTRSEKKIINLCADVSIAFKKLHTPEDDRYANDVSDMCFHIRAIQNITLAREALRNTAKK